MIGAGPSGLKLDVPSLPKFADAEKAFEAGDLDLVAEIETQIWFDGIGRIPAQVNPAMRRLAYDMSRTALGHEVRGLGKRLPDADVPAASRLGDLAIPVLAIVGAHDTPFILAPADYMVDHLPSATKVVIANAAHLPNMDQPAEFQRVLEAFLHGPARF